jgi:hypothetical protein
MLYPEPGRGRGKKNDARKETVRGSFSYSVLKQARFILAHAPDLAKAIMDGG